MFTGIVKEIGTVKTFEKKAQTAYLAINCTRSIQDAVVGDSIAVNGCCLTIIELTRDWWAAQVVEETLKCTCLADLHPEDPVNLEPALRIGDRLGGHFVQGHIDAIGHIRSKTVNLDHSVTVEIAVPKQLLKYIAPKGSIAVDGVSLTIAQVTDHSFSFAMIPHTGEITILGLKQVGKSVNLEVDLLSRYMENMVKFL